MEEYIPQIYRVVVLTLITLSRGRIHTINIISGHSHIHVGDINIDWK